MSSGHEMADGAPTAYEALRAVVHGGPFSWLSVVDEGLKALGIRRSSGRSWKPSCSA
ncbi:hypothetical protein ACIHFC_25510 [Streptomyces sp. NPDC052013]|uniref:hypothetical protein n=1 Tax=Streptomyces sp. NPDC052013 TaxID=3365679 RepID=UPI0037D870E7